jgi:hypothetical protein
MTRGFSKKIASFAARPEAEKQKGGGISPAALSISLAGKA